MPWSIIVPAVIGAGASLLGSKEQSDAIDDASAASLEATQAQINYARESRDIGLMLTEPQRYAGNAALAAMMDMMGMPRPSGGYGMPPGYNLPGGASPPTKDRFNDFATKGTSAPPGVDWSDSFADSWVGNALRQHSAFGGYSNFGEGAGRYSPDNPYAERANQPLSADSFVARWRAGQWERESGNVGSYNEGYLPPGVAGWPEGVSQPDLGAYPEYEWQADPGYDFRFTEGVRAMDTSAAARGFDLSGGYGRKLTKYGQDMASQEYMNTFNRLATMAGYGQVGVQAGANAAMNYGNIASNAMGGYGATRASGYVAQGNTMAGMYGDLASIIGNLPWGKWIGGGGGGAKPPGYEPGYGSGA